MSLSISSILYKSPFPAYVYLYFVSPFTLISTTRLSLSIFSLANNTKLCYAYDRVGKVDNYIKAGMYFV